ICSGEKTTLITDLVIFVLIGSVAIMSLSLARGTQLGFLPSRIIHAIGTIPSYGNWCLLGLSGGILGTNAILLFMNRSKKSQEKPAEKTIVKAETSRSTQSPVDPIQLESQREKLREMRFFVNVEGKNYDMSRIQIEKVLTRPSRLISLNLDQFKTD